MLAMKTVILILTVYVTYKSDFSCLAKGAAPYFTPSVASISFPENTPSDYNRCGESRKIMRAKVIGGMISRPGMWPWQIGIYKDRGVRRRLICGGALISPRWILTTAHCFYRIRMTFGRIWYEKDIDPPTKYTLKAGDYSTILNESTEQVQRAEQIIIHPAYRHTPYYEHDIALVKLRKDVQLDPYVRKVCLPRKGERLVKSGGDGIVAGWGRTTENIVSPVLKYSGFTIQRDDICHNATDYYLNSSVTFCAGDGKGGKDTCQGDSGGGFVRQVMSGGVLRWVAVGLVSWGEGCGLKGKFGYYTRIESFIGWIRKTITPVSTTCGGPSRIAHASFTGSNFSIKSVVTYRCNHGYRLRGKAQRKCKRSGKWTKAPSCEQIRRRVRRPTCQTVTAKLARSPPSNTDIFFRRGSFSQVMYKCVKGFRFINGASRVIMRCRNGRMIGGRPPKCKVADYSPCGVSPTNLRARIVGGNRAGRGTWPWQIGIFKIDHNYNRVLFCGAGALIEKRWVLTAAQYFYKFNQITKQMEINIDIPEKYIFKAGDNNLLNKEESQQQTEAKVIFLHPNYRHSPFFDNDIALVKLADEVELGPFVRTVCLPKAGENLLKPGKHGIVAGWGVRQILQLGQNPFGKKARSNVLRHSAFQIQSNALCASKTNFYFNANVTFCAGDGKGGNDTCKGDSGGSFVREVLRDGIYRWVSAGLVSWGEGCGLKDKYTYYTRVEPFVDWIERTIAEHQDDKKR